MRAFVCISSYIWIWNPDPSLISIMSLALKSVYPWIKLPLVVSAPMLNATTPALAASVSRAGGIGFLAGGTKLAELDRLISTTSELLNSHPRVTRGLDDTLPFGVGFQNWSCDLTGLSSIFSKHRLAAVWLFAPKQPEDFGRWAREIQAASQGKTQIWIQVGTVSEALETMRVAHPDVLVVQGTDAGGHGLRRSASIISLIPETRDALKAAGYLDTPVLAAGGIVDERGAAAAIILGASGVVMGTRFLAAVEAGIPEGWKNEIIRVGDGGSTTKRSTLCDRLKGTVGWPSQYDGRTIINKGHSDEDAGLTDPENVRLYKEELRVGNDAWGPRGRMVTYASTSIGLIRKLETAAAIVQSTSGGAMEILKHPGDSASPKL